MDKCILSSFICSLQAGLLPSIDQMHASGQSKACKSMSYSCILKKLSLLDIYFKYLYLTHFNITKLCCHLFILCISSLLIDLCLFCARVHWSSGRGSASAWRSRHVVQQMNYGSWGHSWQTGRCPQLWRKHFFLVVYTPTHTFLNMLYTVQHNIFIHLLISGNTLNATQICPWLTVSGRTLSSISRTSWDREVGRER